MKTPMIEIRSAPHVKSPRSVELIMRHVVWSLLPICAFYVLQYGISALASILVVTVACLITPEYGSWVVLAVIGSGALVGLVNGLMVVVGRGSLYACKWYG